MIVVTGGLGYLMLFLSDASCLTASITLSVRSQVRSWQSELVGGLHQRGL